MALSTSKSLENNTARNIAVNALAEHQRTETFIQECLNDIFNSAKPDIKERNFATELAFGTMRHIITIDAIIDKFSQRPINKIDKNMLHILRVGMYQMLYLDGQQDHAVVFETVQQVKAVISSMGAHKFVNAILRNAQRALEDNKTCSDYTNHRNVMWKRMNHAVLINENYLPNSKSNVEKFFSVAYSHPKWLADKWLKYYGKRKTHRLCLTNNERPLLTLRVNTLKTDAESYGKKLTEMDMPFEKIEDVFLLLKPINPVLLPNYQEGHFSIQDLTATLVAQALDPKAGENVLDMCAAPGGKTCHIAALMGDKGTILATDLFEEKLTPIKENAKRLGIKSIKTELIDVLESGYTDSFDAILIDAPCSNTGVFARRVEARYKLTPASIKKLVKTQNVILGKAARLIKPGGRILYSTCSIDPNENERLINMFLSDNPNFTLEKEQLTLPQCQIDPETNKTTYWQDGGYYALLTSK